MVHVEQIQAENDEGDEKDGDEEGARGRRMDTYICIHR